MEETSKMKIERITPLLKSAKNDTERDALRDEYRSERGLLTKCEIEKLPTTIKADMIREYYNTGVGERYLSTKDEKTK